MIQLQATALPVLTTPFSQTDAVSTTKSAATDNTTHPMAPA